MSQQPGTGKKRLLLLVKLAIAALVVWGIWRAVEAARGELREESFPLSEVDPWWLVLSGAVYLAGLLPMALFWYAVLRALRQRPRLLETIRAYYLGHLGKYVPGKALVVILRAGAIRSVRVDTTVAAVSIFVETLTMMAVGAFLAAAILLVWFADQWELTLLAVGLMIVAGVPTLPPVFRRIVRTMRVAKANPDIDRLLGGLTCRLILVGWAANLIGWSLLGMSLWATLRAVPLHGPLGSPLELAPLLTASVSLALVAGFLSLLPGGVGVREWVIDVLLVPRFGAVVAIVSAVLLRLAWLAAELAICAILYFATGRSRNFSK